MNSIPAKQKHVYQYQIDAQGRWLCQGNPVADPDLLRILSRSLTRDKQGRFWVRCEGEVHPVEVAEAPFLVSGLDLDLDRAGRLKGVALILSDGRSLTLTDSLEVSDNNVLYARVGRQNLRAKFDRRTFFELTRFLQEEAGVFFIPIGGRRFFIRRQED